MASISYWFLSPSLVLAMIGKVRGWDRTSPTPSINWKKVDVDVVIPAKNEERNIATALSSLFAQDFPIRKVVVFDDGSTDHTSEIVSRYRELTGRAVELITRKTSIGKTPALREFCERTDADALIILDADTVLVSTNYISRLVEELFKNAGVSAACGEVMPLTWKRRDSIAKSDRHLQAVAAEFPGTSSQRPGLFARFLTWFTVCYRHPLYILLQRTLYDGHLKLFGAQLNPVGCAVAYKTDRLRECFAYAKPRIGDNLSNSEDIYIGHFFNWKGYRSVQVIDVHCESSEPPVTRLPHQLYLWSSAFLQSNYYFKDLPLSPFRRIFRGKRQDQSPAASNRVIREQYRAAWGEQITKREGRVVGWLELICFVEKLSYPVILLYFALFNHEALLITLGIETLFCMGLVLATADAGTKLKSAAMLIPAMPIRLLSLGVDMYAMLRCLGDIATGNRAWRK